MMKIWRQARPFSNQQPKQAFEYKAPKDDGRDFQSTTAFLQRYFFFLPFALYAGYKLFFTRKSTISQNTESKLVSSGFENYVVHPYAWRFFSRELQGKFYRSETDESQRVSKLLEKLDHSDIDVKVIRVDILIALKIGQRFLISDKLLEVCQSDESLALILLHELAHEQLEHQINRYVSWSMDYLQRRLFKSNLYEGQKVIRLSTGGTGVDLAKQEFDIQRGGWLHRYSCFYQGQRAFDKFYERNTDAFAVKLWEQYLENEKCDTDKLLLLEEAYGMEFRRIIGEHQSIIGETKNNAKLRFTYNRQEMVSKLLTQ